jgi:hypothetical protein
MSTTRIYERRPLPVSTGTMRTIGPVFILSEAEIDRRFQEALAPKPTKPRRRRERL